MNIGLLRIGCQADDHNKGYKCFRTRGRMFKTHSAPKKLPALTWLYENHVIKTNRPVIKITRFSGPYSKAYFGFELT